jgi:predicted DNA-binding transcriptional regulator YafY
MRRADRLIELVGLMRAAPLSRADDLAERLEVSVRTVYRDIVCLQAQGLPIEGAAGVGYRLAGPVDLPSLTFGHDELEALALGLAYVEQVGDPALSAAARAARGKVDAAWAGRPTPPPSARPIRAHQRPEHRAPAFLSRVREALRERRTLAFEYTDREGCESRREVRPLAVSAYSVGWLLIGWCTAREDFRVFRLDRMRDVAVGGSFDDEPGRMLDDYFAANAQPRRQAERI